MNISQSTPSGKAVLDYFAKAADLEFDSQNWTELAACAEVDPDLWFPEPGQSGAIAKKICASCEVRAMCLEYSLKHDVRYGIWGGYSERERRRLQRALRR